MAHEPPDRGAAAPAPKIALLYVDDEPALLELTTLFLGRAGDLAIDTALSAKLALEKLRLHSYDVIVADYLMPEMDGIEFLKGLRAGGCTIPFIIFTGKGREDVAIEALNTGADFYLQKGGDPRSQFAELGNMIRQAAHKRQAEEALRESEQQLHAILQGSPIPQIVIDRDHRVVHWNRAMEQYSGIPAGEMIGTTRQWRAFYACERPCLADLVVDGKTDEIALWYPGKFASSRHVEGAFEVTDFFPNMGEGGKWLFFTAVAIHDRSGRTIGALETLEDVTEQAVAEANLTQRADEIEDAHAQLEAIFQAFPDVYCRFGEDGTVIDLRTRDSSPLSRIYDACLSRKVRDLLPPAQGTLVEETIRDVHESGLVQIIEFTLEVEGSRLFYEGRFIPLLGSQVIGIFRDITNRKKGEMALRNANEKLHLLSKITRHDILNALTALSAYQDMAAESSSDPLILTYLERQQGLTQQIRGLIEFARFYQRLGAAEPSWQGIEEILARIIPRLDTGDIRVLFNLQGVEVYADPLLERAFSNLIENAVRHGERVTCIQFGYDESPSGLTLTCEDDGTGIPPSDKERIFEKGFGRHSGLGLFLVREIFSITGLTIRETGEYGRGARFEMQIPQGNYRIAGVPERDLREAALRTADLRAPPTER